MFCPSSGTKQGQNSCPSSHIKNYFVLEQKLILINNVLICLSSHNIFQHFLQCKEGHKNNQRYQQYNVTTTKSNTNTTLHPGSVNLLHEYLKIHTKTIISFCRTHHQCKPKKGGKRKRERPQIHSRTSSSIHKITMSNYIYNRHKQHSGIKTNPI